LTYIHVLIGALSAFFFFPQNCRHEICPASIDRDGREAVGSDNTVLYTNFNLATPIELKHLHLLLETRKDCGLFA